MNKLIVIFIVFSVILFVQSIALFILNQIKINSTINHLNQMLDSAINGHFTEKTYDESKLSYLEAKLNRYLTCSLSSEKNLAAEKDRIKTLISDISHQTKTPIANIVLYAQLLAEQKNLDKEAIVFVNEITTQSEKLNFLIQALIKTSRLEAGIIAVKPQKTSIKELITAVCSAINNKALEKKYK